MYILINNVCKMQFPMILHSYNNVIVAALFWVTLQCITHKCMHIFINCMFFFMPRFLNDLFILFVAIGNAYSVLSNEDKRRQYDLYGAEEERQHRRHRHHHYDYSRGFEGMENCDLGADKLR